MTLTVALVAALATVVLVGLAVMVRRLLSTPRAAEDERFRRAAQMTSAWSVEQRPTVRVQGGPAEHAGADR